MHTDALDDGKLVETVPEAVFAQFIPEGHVVTIAVVKIVVVLLGRGEHVE